MNPLLPSIMAVLATQVAEARETGGIQGVVEDESGIVVPNATVTLSGVEIAGERSVTTRDNGSYRFDRIEPGSYELTVTLNGARIARALVQVNLLTTTQANISARLSGVSEEIEVVYQPVVDVTSTSFSASFSEAAIQNLPVGRSYQDVIATVPGIVGRIDTDEGGAGDGNPSVRGEGQYGNNYTLDGVMTRDPATKTFGIGLNFDAIESVQVFTDGAPAEFGQFTGAMANVVTKDGGDEHHGSVAMFYTNHAYFNNMYNIVDLGAAPGEEGEVPTRKRRTSVPIINLTAGGPIVKEKLWYFTALQVNPRSYVVPEGLTGPEADPALGEEDQSIISRGAEFFGKLTWFPSDKLTIRYSFLGDFTARPRWDASQFVAPEAQTNRTDWGITNILRAEYRPSDAHTLELRGGFLNNNLDIRPVNADSTVPSRLDGQGVRHDNATDTDLNDRNRFGGGLTYQGLLDGFLGSHTFRVGAEAWVLVEQRNVIHTGDASDQPWVVGVDKAGNEIVEDGPARDGLGTRYGAGVGEDAKGNEVQYPCTDGVNYSDCLSREHWLNVGPLPQTVYTYFMFAQDEWRPTPNLTINLGVRLDIEDGRDNDGNRPVSALPTEFLDPQFEGEFGPLIMPAPRIGISWDPFGDGKTKITGHYGQYYDLVGNGLWQWANSRSGNGFVRYLRNPDTDSFGWNNTQDPVGDPLIYDENARAYYNEKLNVGIEREIIPNLSIGIRGILSQTNNLTEDVDVRYDREFHPDFFIMNTPIKRRAYRAIELTVNKRFDDRWQVFGAYTLSESFGHTPGQFEREQNASAGSDGNGVGIYLDDIGDRTTREEYYNDPGLGHFLLDNLQGLGRYDPSDPDYADDAGYFGYLPYHSFHQIKLNGTYVAPFGTKFGLVYEFSSGNAWQKKGQVGFYGSGASFPQGRGSRFMPAVHWVDVRVGHEFSFGANQSLEATLDVFNLPDLIAPTDYYQNVGPNVGLTLYRQAPRSIRLGLKYRY